MKNILILPFLILSLNAAAQMDSAYLPPFAFLTYDVKQWEIKEAENDHFAQLRLKGKIDKGFEIKIRLNLGDTLITYEGLRKKFENRTPYGSNMVLLSWDKMDDYQLGVFGFTQDECSRNDIPAMFKTMKFRAAFRIIDNTNLLSVEIDDDSFFFPEELQTEKIVEVAKAIHLVSPFGMDKLLDLPMSTERANELIKNEYEALYKEYFDFNLSKRKCFDDSYFLTELMSFMDIPIIDSLLNYASDSTLCDLVAAHQAALDSSEYANEIKYKAATEFSYSERTELYLKARKEAFSLDEYLDYQLDETQGGPIARLKIYTGENSTSGNNDRYEDIIQKLFANKYTPEHEINDISFVELGDHKYLMKVHGYSNDSIYETLYFHLEKKSATYDVNKVPLPSNESTKWDRIKGPFVAPPYFNENEIEFLMPLWDLRSSINPSPQKQLLAFYYPHKEQANFPAYISIGNSKDIQWIPVSPAAIDSTKYMLIHKITETNNEYFDSEEFILLWNQFDNQKEKERLSQNFTNSFGMNLNKATEVTIQTHYIESDITISPYEVNRFLERNSLVEYNVYVDEGIKDINNDGFEDLYSIVVSNGKVIEGKAYIFSANSFEIIGTKAVVKLLKDNTGFKNLLLKSQIGNHGTNEITDDSDLYRITTR